MRRQFIPWVLGAALLVSLPAGATAGDQAGNPRITSLDIQASEGRIVVSFRLKDAFDERILAKLDSGLEVSFKHQIQVRRRRTLWVDRNVAAKEVTTSVILDGLTRQYTLRRKVNGGLVETLTTSDGDEMRAFMTRNDGIVLELPDDVPLDGKTEVRVRSMLETRFFLFFPYAYRTDWVRLQLNPGPGLEEGDAD